jgi:hypothetical protein
MSEEERSQTDIALGNFFLGCNIPSSVCESDHFKTYTSTLRPSYQAPSRGIFGSV